MLLTGAPKKMLLEGQILAAQEISKSEAQVAERLGVSFMTYRKYAKLYGIYGRVSNKAGIGIDKSIKNEDTGKYPLNQILEGKFPNYSTTRFRERLLRGKRIEQKCNKCNFSEQRITDSSTPLILNYLDGNDKNKKRENIELLCYNCFYLYVNNPFGCKKKFKIEKVTKAGSSDTKHSIQSTGGTAPTRTPELVIPAEITLTDAEIAVIRGESGPS